MFTEQTKAMASYNGWMNQRIYTECAKLSDSERKKDCGAFFKSIHGTLNHILLGDKVWLGRFLGEPFQVSGLDAELHSDFERLRADRLATDGAIIDWAQSLTDADLAGTLEYISIAHPTPRKCQMWLAVAHFFNHQTHHRGQITTLLSQCGLDCGVTDLIALPDTAAPA